MSACSLDWSITPLADASAADASDAGVDQLTSGDAADCTTLAATVAAARQNAKQCVSTAGACTATTTDECGCTITIAAATSPATTAYKQALAAFTAAGCIPTCSQCSAQTPGLCIVGPNQVTYCMPL